MDFPIKLFEILQDSIIIIQPNTILWRSQRRPLDKKIPVKENINTTTNNGAVWFAVNKDDATEGYATSTKNVLYKATNKTELKLVNICDNNFHHKFINDVYNYYKNNFTIETTDILTSKNIQEHSNINLISRELSVFPLGLPNKETCKLIFEYAGRLSGLDEDKFPDCDIFDKNNSDHVKVVEDAKQNFDGRFRNSITVPNIMDEGKKINFDLYMVEMMKILYSDIDGYIANCKMPICYTTYGKLHKEICLFNIDIMDFQVEQEINKGGNKRKNNIIEDKSKKNKIKEFNNKKNIGGNSFPRTPDWTDKIQIENYGNYVYFLTDEEIKDNVLNGKELIKTIDKGLSYKDDDVESYHKEVYYKDLNGKERFTHYYYKKYSDGYEKGDKWTDEEMQRIQDRDG